MLPLHHIHKRKKSTSIKKQPNSFLDYFIYVVAFAGPIMTIPQVYDVWVKKQLSINTLTWESYLVIGMVWLYYGIAHKVKPIIFSNILGIITTGLVVAGALIYQ